MPLADLEAVMPPPTVPVEVPSPNDWAAAEGELGIALPEDYKAFVERYGTGAVSDFIHVLNPVAANKHIRLTTWSAELLGSMRRVREEDPGGVPYSLHPEPCGLFPWAKTDNGNVLFWHWLVPGHEPTVVVVGFRAICWEEYAMSAVTFLARLLDKSLQCPIFPEDFPDAPPVFTPTGGGDPTRR